MCYENRWKPVLILTTLSVVVLLCGLVLFIESLIFYFSPSIVNSKFEMPDTQLFVQQVFQALLGTSIAAILLGVLGTQCNRRPCKDYLVLLIFYGIALLVVWMTILVCGVLLTAFASSGPDVIAGYCNAKPQSSVMDFVVDQIEAVDTKIAVQASSSMCSSICPCDESAVRDWQLRFAEQALNLFNRTYVAGSGPTDPKTGYLRFVTINATSSSDSSFQHCISNIVLQGLRLPESYDRATKLLHYLEQKY